MPKPGEIRYCPELGGRETNAAFVWIPPGSFWMGRGNERFSANPLHFATISKGFWLQKTLLTNLQYEVLAQTRCIAGSENMPKVAASLWSTLLAVFKHHTEFRLPTETQWEYAAKTGLNAKYLYSGSNVVNNVAWTTVKSHNHIDPPLVAVGQLKSNGYGLFDMSGLVSEMCADGSAKLTELPQVDPVVKGPIHRRSCRGGSINDFDSTAYIAERRFFDINSDRFAYRGVRLIWEPKDA